MNLLNVGLGIDRKIPAGIIEKVRLTNRFIISIFSLLVMYSVVFAFLGQILLSKAMLVEAVFTCLALSFNYFGKYTASRYLFLITCNTSILASDILLGLSVYSETYYLPASLISFLIFDLNERRHLFVSLFWPVIFWLLPRFILGPFSDFIVPLTPSQLAFLRIQNFLGALLLTNYFAFLFFKSLAEFQEAMVHSNKFKALGEMSAGIAHEINNPVAIIYGKANIIRRNLKEGPFDRTKISDDLEKIEKTAMRISKIVKGLKSFSRVGDSDPFIETKVSDILDDVLNLCHDKLVDQGIKVQVVYDDSEFKILCRQHQIAQVVMNMIGNSVDAILGTDSAWVRVEVLRRGGRVRIEVTDSGPGIPTEVVAKMMNPFFTTKDVGKGTGLGLSISKGIIESHQGQLYYDATSKNTKFIIDLPA